MAVRCTYDSVDNAVSTVAEKYYKVCIFCEVMTSKCPSMHNTDSMKRWVILETVVRHENCKIF
jgi:hypothetical protein